jgi:hypothetical protein
MARTRLGRRRGAGALLPFLFLSASAACEGAIIDGGTTLDGLWNAEPKTPEGWPPGSCAASSCTLGPGLMSFSSFEDAELALVGRFRACAGVTSNVPDYAGDEYAADGWHYYLLGPDLHRDPNLADRHHWSIVSLGAKDGFTGNVQFKIAVNDSISVDWVILSACPRVLSNNGTTFIALPEPQQ